MWWSTVINYWVGKDKFTITMSRMAQSVDWAMDSKILLDYTDKSRRNGKVF
jgi:hypothetical protein